MKKKLFIVGVGRSGTTLVQSMLDSHPGIIFLPETVFIRRYLAKAEIEKVYNEKGKAYTLKMLGEDRYLKRLGIVLNEDLLKDHGGGTVSLDQIVYENILKLYSQTKDKSYKFIGDKDPRLVEYIPVLDSFFPDCRILHIIRDPRDIIDSKKEADWSKHRPVYFHVFAGRVQYLLGRYFGKALKERYFEVVFEKLLKDPVKELKKICDWLDISYDESMLAFSSSAKELVSEDEMGWKKETLGPLLTDNTGLWKNKLAPEEILLTESCCKTCMEDFSYKKDKRKHKLKFVDRLMLLFKQCIIKCATRPYIFYRIYKNKKLCSQKITNKSL